VKYLSVCSGIEAATVAWHGLGWTPVAFSEIEAFPAAVLAHHYPTVPNLGDLTKYREWPEELLVEVDLLVGGTPCQAFSVAGKRQSLDDERGNLSLIYVNLYHHINEVRKRHGRPPAIALWENVPGVLSTKDNAFGCFIGGLLGCDEAPQTESGKWDKAGFLSSETVRVGYRVLDAQYFGVAQRRRRIFLVAVPCELVERFGERACPSEILSLRESVLGNSAPVRTPGETAAGAVVARIARNGGGSNADVDAGHLVLAPFTKSRRAQSPSDHETLVNGDISPTVNQFDVGETRATTIVAAIGFNWMNGGGYGNAHDGLAITEEAVAPVSRSQVYAVACLEREHTSEWQRCDSCENDWCNIHEKHAHECSCAPLCERDDDPSCKKTIVERRYARRLTPLEVARLQGFPADYLDITFRKKPAADGPKYRALGNSMAVPCMWWLGYRIHHATGPHK